MFEREQLKLDKFFLVPRDPDIRNIKKQHVDTILFESKDFVQMLPSGAQQVIQIHPVFEIANGNFKGMFLYFPEDSSLIEIGTSPYQGYWKGPNGGFSHNFKLKSTEVDLNAFDMQVFAEILENFFIEYLSSVMPQILQDQKYKYPTMRDFEATEFFLPTNIFKVRDMLSTSKGMAKKMLKDEFNEYLTTVYNEKLSLSKVGKLFKLDNILDEMTSDLNELIKLKNRDSSEFSPH